MVQSQRGLLRNFYFSGKMMKMMKVMNHHITKTAKVVLWDFLREIAPLIKGSPSIKSHKI